MIVIVHERFALLEETHHAHEGDDVSKAPQRLIQECIAVTPSPGPPCFPALTAVSPPCVQLSWVNYNVFDRLRRPKLCITLIKLFLYFV